MTPDDTPNNPSALPPEQLARLVGLPEDVIERHVAQGAPTNANGTVHLVHYAAWLNSNTPGSGPNGGDR